MRLAVLFVAMSLLTITFSATGARMDRFESGDAAMQADLTLPDRPVIMNITLPVECQVLNATMNVTGIAPQIHYPIAPEVLLNDTRLWEFNGTGYGALGMQDQFSDGTANTPLEFGAGGGTNGTSIRLPQNALVISAAAEVNLSGPVYIEEVVNLTGSATGDGLGLSVSNAGDIDNDGYDDVIVGSPFSDTDDIHDTGRAYLYWGGYDMYNVPDVILSGVSSYNDFGYSVSCAGDVNNDGCDDVIVGAYRFHSYMSSGGRAYIYFGGLSMTDIPDVILNSSGDYEQFGFSVSDAGDVNGDGYGDVIVGAPIYDTAGPSHAYIYFGGPAMHTTPDVALTGATDVGLGYSVSGAGDVNRDGYADVIVGAPSKIIGGANASSAFIYLGGPAMDSVPDVVLTNGASDDKFGCSVSNAGDLNGDGYDDVIVGAFRDCSGGAVGGRAYIYYGDAAMDNITDVTLAGAGANDQFGFSVSSAGDLNMDGYDDVIVGAPRNGSGYASVYFGGPAMDNSADAVLRGSTAGDMFGFSVSNAGDVNRDDIDEVIVGAYRTRTDKLAAGCAHIYSISSGIQNLSLAIGASRGWDRPGCQSGDTRTGDLSKKMNEYLRSASPSGNDSYGNLYVDVPINISADSEGNITLFNVSIVYQYSATVPDFAAYLNSYISAHSGEGDANGSITVPILVRSRSAGEILLGGLNITFDGAPRLLLPVPDLELDEYTANNTLLDMYRYFQDDFELDNNLAFSVEGATNSSRVNPSISGGRFLSADALAGEANDNWTGVASLRVRCTDSYGFSTVSNSFDIVIRNVNDPPVITSTPPANATAKVLYSYQLTAIDGDNDTLSFSLSRKPDGMSIESATGKILWTPGVWQSGKYTITVNLTDGNGGEAVQTFVVKVEKSPEPHPDVFNTYLWWIIPLVIFLAAAEGFFLLRTGRRTRR